MCFFTSRPTAGSTFCPPPPLGYSHRSWYQLRRFDRRWTSDRRGIIVRRGVHVRTCNCAPHQTCVRLIEWVPSHTLNVNTILQAVREICKRDLHVRACRYIPSNLVKLLTRHRLGCFCTHHSLEGGGGVGSDPPAISKTDGRRETDEAAFERYRRYASKTYSKI